MPVGERRTPKLDDLIEAERDVMAKLGDMPIDFDVLAFTSNLHRAVGAIRRELEQTVLAEVRLSWTAFTAMWVLWIWGEMETRHLAGEADVTKGTLTGVLDTLEKRGLVTRRRRETDRRLVTARLTDAGELLITDLFPRFNAAERRILALMSERQREVMTVGLRRILRALSAEE